jgi:hypothetical protein
VYSKEVVLLQEVDRFLAIKKVYIKQIVVEKVLQDSMEVKPIKLILKISGCKDKLSVVILTNLVEHL